jgi:hypothetical protein
MDVDFFYDYTESAKARQATPGHYVDRLSHS